MRFAYAAVLLVSIAGMLVLDRRHRLVVFAAPLRALAVLTIGVGFFLVWDLAGIGLRIFFVGDGPYQSGVRLAPELPIEEVGFLLLLCHLALVLAAVAERVRRARRGAGAGE
ncbi:lycopene cyclase domain-containing protein [Isoptericola sp. b441]|uniref:Lycopene cyclase domain-containing protein n=1 Tax=Actinotalea lenta TaxID=3064654 RepID=A0ABT9DBH7_9CELL|nr:MULTISPECIES: lycopene cyclase domain-containing protein [unclassified Isoptericola]MDO8106302.1 lycopene cyclase domain-containing protein [Isoptericola sp. b441]MDO8121978.1 lycopene cyclase domain-containing protein [Isoptericola sp. b490]